MINKFSVFIGLVVVFVIGYTAAFNYLNSVPLTISQKNIASFSVQNNTGSELATSAAGLPVTLRVPKDSAVVVSYTGKEKYASGKQTVEVHGAARTLTVDPFFSKNYLRQLSGNESIAVTHAIKAYDSRIPKLYSVEGLTLYHFGDWASARLVRKGGYSLNSDTLKIILHASNSSWSVVAAPNLIFYKDYNPSIPTDILYAVNKTSS